MSEEEGYSEVPVIDLFNETEEGESVFDQPEGTDFLLALLVSYAENLDYELDVTLSIGGNLITGRVTSVRNYFLGLGAEFKAALPNRPTGDTFTAIGNIWAEADPTGKTFKFSKPAYIHLRDAHVVSGTGNMIPESGTSWRCKLSAVDAVSIGRLKPTED